MNIRKYASLGLAVALQVLPLTRAFVAATPAVGSSYAIIATWIAGALALMGGVDSVSGASSIAVGPVTGTTGVPYSGLVQYSGGHSASVRSWELRNNWNGAVSGCNTIYQIAPGLWLTNSANYIAKIGGIPTTAGTYTFTVRVWSGSGCSGGDNDTRSATITINPGGVATPPTITTQPATQTVTAGANVSFTVGASGTAPLSYQWRLNGGNIAGATSATLTLNSVTVGQSGNSYSCFVTNSAGNATSSAASLTVNPAVIAPTITTQPTTQTVTAGANVSFTVGASGTAPLSYQWRLNGGNIAGATSATLTLNSVTVGQSGNSYSCFITNSAGNATSSAATLTVNPAVIAPTISTQPANQSVLAGANASFAVVAAGTAPLRYQWWLNNAPIPGATSATLTLTGVTLGQSGGSYSCVVTNSAGSATSGAATLIVSAATVAPIITEQPATQTVTAGANVSFTVGASGTAPLSYQWRLNGGNIAGATSATLTLNSVTVGQSGGSYSCFITNSAGNATSSAATLTVNPAAIAPTITTQPTTQTVTAGANVSFTVGASGTAPLSYQWRLNGGNIAGATSATLTLNSVTVGQSGNSYSCFITNSAGNATSSAATLTVNEATQATTFAGVYNGLFFEDSGVSVDSVGQFSLALSENKGFTAWLQIRGTKYSMIGTMNSSLTATSVILRNGTTSLTVELRVGQGSEAGQIFGRVTDGMWNSPLSGGRGVSSSPFAGDYTVIIPGTTGNSALPAGHGYATLHVSPDGLGTMSGTLADGARFSQSAYVTVDGDWPLFANLYSGKGAIVSWLAFANLSTSDLNGTLIWIKQAGASTTSFPLGFTNSVNSTGSIYVAPAAGGKAINLSGALMSFSGGSLSSSFNNIVSVNAGSQVVNLSPNEMVTTIMNAVGSFTGQVREPGTGALHMYGGVVFQKQNAGYGTMTGVPTGSRVILAAP